MITPFSKLNSRIEEGQTVRLPVQEVTNAISTDWASVTLAMYKVWKDRHNQIEIVGTQEETCGAHIKTSATGDKLVSTSTGIQKGILYRMS